MGNNEEGKKKSMQAVVKSSSACYTLKQAEKQKHKKGRHLSSKLFRDVKPLRPDGDIFFQL